MTIGQSNKHATVEEFIESYCTTSGVKWEWLSQYRKAVPCDCGDETCRGFAMIPKDEEQS